MDDQSISKAVLRRPMCILVDDELHEQITAAAERDSRTISNYVRVALTKHLSEATVKDES